MGGVLFNSLEFIFVFLPSAVILYYLLGRHNTSAALWWLVLASLVFYAWWSFIYLFLLLFSITVNYFLGRILQFEGHPAGLSRKGWFIFGLVFNLGMIGYFKYYNFFVDSINTAVGLDWVTTNIVLPLGISFYSFQKIAYLVDSYRREVKNVSLLNYALFVSFFPQLIAGPIVHHNEIIHQFSNPKIFRFDPEVFGGGLAIFLLGLAKKVVIADNLGEQADLAFGAAGHGAILTFFEGWAGALAYTLQLYFDFSGYSDMAIGLGLMFGIQLPLNFNSPYQATSIIDFWRRWHITLSRFLRDYLYFPLGGNRNGPTRRQINLMLTMLIGGLWHGAGWTFVLWGGLHGAYLSINHLWNERVRPLEVVAWYRRAVMWLVTMLAVIIAWVLFRAPTLEAAKHIYEAMLGMNGAQLPTQILNVVPFLKAFVEPVGKLDFLGDGKVMGVVELAVMLALGFAIAVFVPHLYKMKPNWRVALLVPSFALAMQQVLFARDISPFLYFQF